MVQRIPSALMVLSFALFTIIGTHYLLDDLDVTTATSERIHTGNAFFIVIDILCLIVCVAGVALFTSLFLTSKKSSTSSGPLPWRLAA
jgi:DMSO/TMAO reductase YedYZ heme-binding membrane subunit